MRVHAFRGGVHPPEAKLTAQKPIRDLPAPELVHLPLSQHIGAPALPTVKVGDQVRIGQVIAEAGGFVSASVHATISGKVKMIKEVWSFTGRMAPAITIENDGEDIWNLPEPIDDPFSVEPKLLIQRIQACGLVGLGGATFPTHVKLSPPAEKPIETVIVNGVECEPYLTADHRLMLEEPEDIIKGARLLAHILGAKKVYIGIEANKPDAIKLLKEKAGGAVEVVSLKVLYPQGAEKQLIHAITGRDVPSGGLPMDVGALVQNVGTAAAVWQAATEGRPLVRRVVTVTGQAVVDPGNLRVTIGTPAQALVDACGGTKGEIGKIISGGPMMGFAVHTLDMPIIKGTSGLVLLGRDQVTRTLSRPCLRCGTCVQNCPMGLEPTIIARLTEKGRFDEAEQWHALDCIECGCCSYGCPSAIPLVQLIRWAKSEILAMRKRRQTAGNDQA